MERNKKKKKGKEWLKRIHAPTNLLASENFLGRLLRAPFKLDRASSRKLEKDKL